MDRKERMDIRQREEDLKEEERGIVVVVEE